MVPRIEHGLPSDVYRAAPGLSHSDSKRLRRTPYHFKRLSEPRPEELTKAPTPQMFVGTLAHAALLEPELFDSRYMVGPDVNKNSKEWKAFAEGCTRVGAEPIDARRREQAFAMAQALRELPDLADLMRNGRPEVSMWWHCPRSGVLCKGRPDFVAITEHGKSALLVDVKSTEDASAEAFSKSVANFGYHTQADWYCEGYSHAAGVPVLGMLFAVVESEFPYACASYVLDDEALRRAREVNDEARRVYAECKRRDEWPGYAPGVQVIGLPRWA